MMFRSFTCRSFVAVLLAATLGVPWVVPVGGAPPAVAASFDVTSLLDGHDADLGDGICDTGTGVCTLRAAIEQANHLGGSHEITLGPGIHRIGTNAGAVDPVWMDVTANVTLVGAGQVDTVITLDSSGGDEIFRLLANSSLSVSALTLTQEPGSGWADGIVVTGDGASLFVDDVLFLGLGNVAVAAWGSWPDPDPANFDIWIEDSTFDGGGVGYSLLAVSSGGAQIDIVRTEIHSTTYALLVANDNATGDDVLRVIDSDLDGSFFPDDPPWGMELYENWNVEIVGTTVRHYDSAIHYDGNSLVIRDSEVTDNDYIGIGAYAWDTGTVTIDRTLVARNGQSALDIVADLVLTNSTLSDNDFGGYLDLVDAAPALIENTTISGNHYLGMYFVPGSELELRNVTITDNGNIAQASDSRGLYLVGELVAHNSVISGNHNDCLDEVWGSTVVLGDHNVDGDGSCNLTGANDQSGIDPLLGPLAGNGGPTPTHALLPGSPLLDAGNDAECPATDQRGATRPFDGDGDGTAQCDIGAVEAGAEVFYTSTVTWSGSTPRHRLLAPDQPLAIEATSVPGGTATAQVSLSSWYPGADTTAPIAAAPAEVVLDVALTEGPAGVYTGTMPLAGVEEITAIDAVVAEGGEDRVGSATSGLPVRVAGAIELTTSLGVPAWMLPTARAEFASALTADGDSVLVEVSGVTSSRWLRPAKAYEIDIVDGQRRRVGLAASAVEVRGGLVSPVTISGTALPYIPFSLVVEDSNGFPVGDVKVTVTDDATGDQVVKAATGADGRIEGLARGAGIGVHIDPLDEPYLAVDVPIALTQLDEEFTIEVGAALPTAVVTGVVDRADRPIPGARVSFTSQVGDRFFTTATTTGEDGSYSAAVFHGDVTFAVDELRSGRASVTTAIVGDTTVDLTLSGPMLIDVTLNLQTRYAGDPVPTPVDLDWRSGGHLGVSLLANGQSTRVSQDVVTVPYHAGDTIELCADGYKADLPAACSDVTVDTPTQTGTATLLLEQVGAITGGLTWTAVGYVEGQTYRPELRADIFRVDGTSITKVGSVRPELQTTPASGELQLAEFFAPVFEAGTYEVRFELHEYVTTPCQSLPGGDPLCRERWVRSEYARVRTTVSMDSIVDVGTLPFTVPGRRFTSSVESNVTISPGVLVPGDVARVRVSAHNGSVDTVDGAAFEIDLPGGTTLVADSVTVAGEPAASSVADGVLTVPVGTIEPGQTVVATAWLDVPVGIVADSLQVAGSITYGVTTEPLGSSAAVVRRLSINSLERTADLAVPVWGRSFPGSTVEVTVDGSVAGTAVASAGGVWSTVVTLPEVPLPKSFALAANTSGAAGSFSTPNFVVSYDADQPSLIRAVMQQSSGRVVEFDPRRGIARFPYVFVPNEQVLIDLEFDPPTAIHPPTVWVGSRRAEAEYDAATGMWRATLFPSFHDLGEIRVSWEPLPKLYDLSPSVPQPLLTPAQARAMLPPGLDSFSDVTLVDPTPGAAIVSATFPDASETGETSELTFTTETIEYTPTNEDLESEASTGIPIWGLEVVEVEQLDGTVDLEASFVIPQYALADGVEAYAPVPRQAGAAAATLTKLTWKEVKNVDNLWTGAASAGDLSGAINAGEFSASLEVVLDLVESRCTAGPAAGFLDRLRELNVDYLRSLGVSAVLMLLGLVAGPETLGLGTLAAWGLTELINRVIGDALNRELGKVVSAVETQCRPEPEQPDPECAPEWALVPPALGGPDCQPIADPIYIHDPSGFVYEVLEENRLEGVTATLETAASPTGPWSIWDAEWFLQQNPLITNVEGRYGWDVPEGWWRVRWEMEGYETQYSEALEVLPPHFDVNADLRNLTPPTVASASATAGQSVIEVTFDQLMDVDFVTGESLEVVAPAGEDWTVSPVDEATTAGGDPVASTFTIDVGRTLAVGEEFGVEVDLAVRSASGVAVESLLMVDVTVEAAPPEPQSITFAPIANVVYGADPIAVSPTASSGLPVALSAVGPCSIQVGKNVVVSGVGKCSVTASQAGNSAWLPATSVVREFSISSRPLTVTAHSASSTTGDVVPTFGATAVGLRAGDTVGSLGGLSCATVAPSSGGVLTTAGSFAVTCSGLKAPNYAVTYVAGVHTVASGVVPPPTAPPPTPPPAAEPVVPARLLDTRSGVGNETIDGRFEGIGRVAAGSITVFEVAGRGGVPDVVGAVMLNVTAVRPDASGYLTVYPCDQPRPLASNVNYTAGQVIPNAVLAKVSATGTVCIFSLAAADLVVDVNGYVPAGGSPESVVPARVLETRSGDGNETVDGRFEGVGRVAAGAFIELEVAGRGGVPDDVAAVMLNVTAVRPDARGYLTVYPCDEPRPLASNVNYLSLQVVPNAVLAKVAGDGTVCIYTLAATDLVVDVNGYVPMGATPEPVVPARVLETRSGAGNETVDGRFEGVGRVTAGSVTAFEVAGRGGVPDDIGAVMVNVTAVNPGASGYLTVYPCDQPRPLASNVNYTAGQVIPNAVLAKVAATGTICIYSLAATDLVVDVNGYI